MKICLIHIHTYTHYILFAKSSKQCTMKKYKGSQGPHSPSGAQRRQLAKASRDVIDHSVPHMLFPIGAPL